MPTPTYNLIASNVLTSTATDITFSSITGSYQDLILVVRASTSALAYIGTRLNNDTGSNYQNLFAEGTGSGSPVSSIFTDTNGWLTPGNAARPNTGSVTLAIAHFNDYSSAEKHKLVLVRANNQTNGTVMQTYRWPTVDPITIIQVRTSSGNFEVGSAFYLYGIVS